MKMFYGHLFAFGMMTGICFVGISVIILLFRLVFAFIAWELTPLILGWAAVLLAIRFILVFSAIIGVWFACSEEGRSLAKDVANG
jgi:hypothetical protein